MRGSPCIYDGGVLSDNTGLYPASGDGLSDTHLTFLWPSDEETGPVVRVGFRFLGRPGPRRAGLRGVSSFLLAHADGNTQEDREELLRFIIYLNAKGWHSKEQKKIQKQNLSEQGNV